LSLPGFMLIQNLFAVLVRFLVDGMPAEIVAAWFDPNLPFFSSVSQTPSGEFRACAAGGVALALVSPRQRPRRLHLGAGAGCC